MSNGIAPKEPSTFYGFIGNALFGLAFGIGFFIAQNVLGWLGTMIHR